MSSSTLKKVGLGLGAFLIFMLVAWQVPKVVTSADQLSVEEATNRVKYLYKGEIIEAKEHPPHILVTFKRDNEIYEASIDRKSGNFTEVKKVEGQGDNKGKEVIPNNNLEQYPSPSPNSPSEEQIKQLTEQEAAAIALKQINGEVDDIDLEYVDGVIYYLVEVERNDGSEAIVQINAITGEVHSITWDD